MPPIRQFLGYFLGYSVQAPCTLLEHARRVNLHGPLTSFHGFVRQNIVQKPSYPSIRKTFAQLVQPRLSRLTRPPLPSNTLVQPGDSLIELAARFRPLGPSRLFCLEFG